MTDIDGDMTSSAIRRTAGGDSFGSANCFGACAVGEFNHLCDGAIDESDCARIGDAHTASSCGLCMKTCQGVCIAVAVAFEDKVTGIGDGRARGGLHKQRGFACSPHLNFVFDGIVVLIGEGDIARDTVCSRCAIKFQAMIGSCGVDFRRQILNDSTHIGLIARQFATEINAARHAECAST